MPGRFAVDPSISAALASIRRSMTHIDVRKDPPDMATHLLAKVEAAVANFGAAKGESERDAAAAELMEACFDAGYWRRTLGAGSAKAFNRAKKRKEAESAGHGRKSKESRSLAIDGIIREVVGQELTRHGPSHTASAKAQRHASEINKRLEAAGRDQLSPDAIRKRHAKLDR